MHKQSVVGARRLSANSIFALSSFTKLAPSSSRKLHEHLWSFLSHLHESGGTLFFDCPLIVANSKDGSSRNRAIAHHLDLKLAGKSALEARLPLVPSNCILNTCHFGCFKLLDKLKAQHRHSPYLGLHLNLFVHTQLNSHGNP